MIRTRYRVEREDKLATKIVRFEKSPYSSPRLSELVEISQKEFPEVPPSDIVVDFKEGTVYYYI